MSIKTILLAVFSIALLGATPAWACGCGGTPACIATALGLTPDPVVFIGTVTAIGAPASSRPGKGVGRTESPVEFRVTEMFSGGKETTITGYNPVNTSCGVNFEVGHSYLIHMQAGNMLVGTCNVQEPGLAQTRILQLRAARDRRTAPSLLGRVTLPFAVPPMYQADLDALMANAQPAADVAVIARAGNAEYRTRTGRDGRYEFRGLPTAEYQLAVVPPDGTSRRPLDTVRFKVAAGMSCGFDIPLYHDTQISVSVVDAKGMPLTGRLVAIPPELSQTYPNSDDYEVEAAGLFQFRRLSPGRYRFEFFPVVDGRLNWQMGISGPEVIDIKNGERLEKRIVIP